MKEVGLVATIHSDGRIAVKPVGTSGNECVDLTEFLKNLEELQHESTEPEAPSGSCNVSTDITMNQ